MNPKEQHEGSGPIVPGSPLARKLDDFAVPGLSAGFADRVLAAAEARPAPLPELRRASGGRRWRIGQRIAIGVASFGALATAAAATGLLQQLAIPVPSAQTVWASITGKEPAAAAIVVPATAKPSTSEPAKLASVEIVGPIDTPEELGEAFRRIDEVRQGRSIMRRQNIEQRIEREKERRLAAGLPLPSPEQEARIRGRIDAAEARRESLIDQRLELRREEMLDRVEAGEALNRQDIVRPLREDQRAFQQREKFERLRRMSPEARREAVRRLPPEERRALREAWQERRALRPGNGAPVTAEPSADSGASSQPELAPQDLSQSGTPQGEPQG